MIACADFVNVSCEDLVELISKDEIEVTSEETVYSAVIRWMYHDFESRRDALPLVMGSVCLPLVSSAFFSTVVEQESLLLQRCQLYIQEAASYISSPSKRRQWRHSPRVRPRKPYGLEDVILTVGDHEERIEQYDADTDSWNDLGPAELGRFNVAACFFNSYLYAIGGYRDTYDPSHPDEQEDDDVFMYFNSVDRYHVKQNKWTNVATLLQGRA